MSFRLCVLLVLVACDSAPAPAAAPAKVDPPGKAVAPKPVELPPAPAGAVVIGKLYVETCAADGACPMLLQVPADEHCRTRTTGGHKWRLPTRDELESWVGKPGLVGFDGFHWSGTPFADAPDQVWIFDPTSASKTTIPKDRKPFKVRCVAQP